MILLLSANNKSANVVFILTGVHKIHFTPSKNMTIGGNGQQALS